MPLKAACDAVRAANGEWVVGETLCEARARAGKVQGRRTTAGLRWPIEVPPGDWVRTLSTTWVEPAYLEPDASWCAPGGTPASPLANGGAFGGKLASQVGAVARRLADEHGRIVRVLLAREDVVRLGPKRPPLAAGIDPNGVRGDPGAESAGGKEPRSWPPQGPAVAAARVSRSRRQKPGGGRTSSRNGSERDLAGGTA